MVIVHWLCHILGFDYGLPYGSFGWYNAWSGFLGDVVIFGGISAWWRHRNCHVKWCVRLGRHQVEGKTWIVCRKHHKDDHPTAQDVKEATP